MTSTQPLSGTVFVKPIRFAATATPLAAPRRNFDFKARSSTPRIAVKTNPVVSIRVLEPTCRPRPTRLIPVRGSGPAKIQNARKSAGIIYSGVILLVAMLYAAYIFNVSNTQVILDNIFTNFNNSVQSHNTVVVNTTLELLPFFGMMILAFAIYFAIMSLVRGARHAIKARRLARRPEISLTAFAAEAHKAGISPLVAREAYAALRPVYLDTMRVALADRLSEDLNLSPAAALDLHRELIYQTSRRLNGATEKQLVLRTVLDVLTAVEIAPQRSLAPL